MPTTRRAAFPGAEQFIPTGPVVTLAQLRSASQVCQGCDLFQVATQAVFGEGAAGPDQVSSRRLMLIGEQPGDREDLSGHPFVGPAGRVLREVLLDAGIDPAQTYLTNAVKHFRWTPSPRGKRRLHAKPTAAEVRACRPWLDRELLLVRPKVVVCLGVTAGQSVFGPSFRVARFRGNVRELTTPVRVKVVATIHPSLVLRRPTSEARSTERRALVADLASAWALTDQ